MNWVVWSLVILLAFVILLAITKLNISIDLLHDGDNDHFTIKFRALFGIVRYTVNIPLVKVDTEEKEIVMKEETSIGSEGNNGKKKRKRITPPDILDRIHDMKELANHVIHLHKIVRQFLQNVYIEKFYWHTCIGTGDAAEAGMISGVAWSIKGIVLQWISRYMKLKKKPLVSITPDFYHPVSKTSLTCMIHFRLGYAMLAGLRFVKYWVGGRAKLRKKSIPLLTKDEKNDQSA
ncbi:DUF2953 domain-containing protein [Bacillus sp. FJAT-47783]|uniref:DUF2953 domain-containing protein n=1 Tax=Bacillus sp. FJAT-47783 TaxID=2922712 RepID=UPI001FAD2DD4|nr:DUF2953 domain-containing protein [Bacillus sp. FJAT-47783]